MASRSRRGKIVITDAMIEAGADEILNFDREEGNSREGARLVFEAMWARGPGTRRAVAAARQPAANGKAWLEAFDVMVAKDRLQEIQDGTAALIAGDALKAELDSLLAE